MIAIAGRLASPNILAGLVGFICLVIGLAAVASGDVSLGLVALGILSLVITELAVGIGKVTVPVGVVLILAGIASLYLH